MHPSIRAVAKATCNSSRDLVAEATDVSSLHELHETRGPHFIQEEEAHQWLVKLRLIPPHKLQLAAAAAAAAASSLVLLQSFKTRRTFVQERTFAALSLFRSFFSFS